MTDKRVPILNSSVVPTLGADSHFYLYGNGEVISLVPAWDGITVDDIYAFVDELPEGKAVDAIYVPFLHEQGTTKDEEETSHNVMAETDDEALLEAWGSDTPEPRVNGLDEGHDYFLVYDENDGEPKPALGREMTKKFRLMFDVPDAELESFTASLLEAGFAPVFSEQVEYNNSPDEAGTVRDAEGKVSDAEGTVRDADGEVVEMLF